MRKERLENLSLDVRGESEDRGTEMSKFCHDIDEFIKIL